MVRLQFTTEPQLNATPLSPILLRSHFVDMLWVKSDSPDGQCFFGFVSNLNAMYFVLRLPHGVSYCILCKNKEINKLI